MRDLCSLHKVRTAPLILRTTFDCALLYSQHDASLMHLPFQANVMMTQGRNDASRQNAVYDSTSHASLQEEIEVLDELLHQHERRQKKAFPASISLGTPSHSLLCFRRYL